jgi:hypothetical protein
MSGQTERSPVPREIMVDYVPSGHGSQAGKPCTDPEWVKNKASGNWM